MKLLRKLWKKIIKVCTRTPVFVAEAAVTTVVKTKDFAVGVVRHTEAISLALLASVGLSSLMATMTLPVALPAFIELELLFPVVASFIVLFLLHSAGWRAARRHA